MLLLLSDWLWLMALGASLGLVNSMPALDQPNKNQEPTRPKVVKRSQEVLMFGNQQNRPNPSQIKDSTNHLSSLAEKRTLSNSGLDDAVETLESQQQQQQQQVTSAEDNQPKALPIASYAMEQQQATPQQRERNYEYGKVLVNELGDVRGAWDLPAYSGRFYALSDEERRKRSSSSSGSSSSSNNKNETPSSLSSTSLNAKVASSSTTSPVIHAQPQHLAVESKSSFAAGQPNRNNVVPPYPDIRFKRQSELQPEDLLALLSLYDTERRNRRNWRMSYDNDEYENTDDESNLVGLDDQDPRGGTWLEQQLAYPQPTQQRYLSAAAAAAADPVLASELAALSRSRPNSFYEQYLAQQQQYANDQQYGLPYVQPAAYYPPEKSYMIARKRAQNYDSYGSSNGLLLDSRAYPSYQHRMIY